MNREASTGLPGSAAVPSRRRLNMRLQHHPKGKRSLAVKQPGRLHRSGSVKSCLLVSERPLLRTRLPKRTGTRCGLCGHGQAADPLPSEPSYDNRVKLYAPWLSDRHKLCAVPGDFVSPFKRPQSPLLSEPPTPQQPLCSVPSTRQAENTSWRDALPAAVRICDGFALQETDCRIIVSEKQNAKTPCARSKGPGMHPSRCV